jgi:chromosome segregation ATPase
MSDRLTYEEFSQLADKLYFESVEMPTSKKTYDVLLKGSLTTHQHYLIRWKAERKQKPTELPQQLEQIIVHKGREYADLLWQHLQKSHEEEHIQIKQGAESAIAEIQESLKVANLECEAALNKNETLNQQLELLETENKSLQEKIIENEKLRYAAEEAQRSLETQLLEIKENNKVQMAYLTIQQEKYHQQEQSLKQQLKEQAEKDQATLKELQQSHQKEKTIYQLQLNEEKHKNQKLENLLHQKETEYNKLVHQMERTQEQCESLELQWNTLRKEHQALTLILQKKEVLLGQKDTEFHHTHLQLTEAKQKIISLEKDIKESHWVMGKLEEKVLRKSNRK